MIIELPYPISVNRLYAHSGRVRLSEEAVAYKTEVGWLARAAGIEPLAGPLALRIDAYRPQKRGDIDNLTKALLDSLIGFAFEDDSQIVAIDIRRFDDKHNPRIVVEVVPSPAILLPSCSVAPVMGF